MKTQRTTREALAKLKIDRGGRGGSVQLASGWSVTLHEPPFDARRKREPDDAFALLTLRHPNGREKTIGLARDALVTKGRSHWRRDNRYRMTPEAIEEWSVAIDAAIAKYTPELVIGGAA